MKSTTSFFMILLMTVTTTAVPPNYEEHIKPLFRAHCLKCHNADEASADLDLSSYPATIKGGSSGPIVKAGRPDSSQLYRAMAHREGAEAMPPESPRLSDEKLAVVADWIRGGLIAGKGGTSQLRSITGMATPVRPGAPAPIPNALPAMPPVKIVRPPIPQALAVSPGAQLFAVSGHEQILLFRRSEGEEERKRQVEEKTKNSSLPSSLPAHLFTFLGALPFAEGTIHDIGFSQNGSLLLAAGGRGAHSGRVVLFDMKTGRRVAEIGEEVESVLAADVSSDHQFVALGGPGKIVKIFRTDTGETLHRIRKHTDWVTAIAFSPDGKLVATGDRGGGIHILETEKGAIIFTLDEHKVRITDLNWRADGTIIASGAEDGNLILWSIKDGFPLRNIVAHASRETPRYSRRTGILAVDFSADGQLLTSGRDGFVRVWSGDGGKVTEVKFEKSLPVTAAFVDGSKSAIVGCFDGSLRLIDLSSKSPIQTLQTAPAKPGVN